MALIVNITWFVKPEKRTQFIAELSSKLPVTKAYDGCRWLYLADNADAKEDRLRRFRCGIAARSTMRIWLFVQKAVSSEFEEKYYTADPQWKYMPMLMNFNK